MSAENNNKYDRKTTGEASRKHRREYKEMRFSEFAAVFTEQPRVMKRDVAAVYVGGPENLKELEAAQFVEPVRRTKRSVCYDKMDLDAAIDRARAEGWPKFEES